MQTEQVFDGSAQNVITVRLSFPNTDGDRVRRAADEVFASADIFKAGLYQEGNDFFFLPEGCGICPCEMLALTTAEEAGAWMEEQDCVPMDYRTQLYQGRVIPLDKGGCILYVRFHHVIIDGYGMSLFAQKVVDVLEGKTLTESVFFGTEDEDAEQESRIEDAGAEHSFWNTYFADAEFEPEIFSGVPESDSRKILKDSMGEEAFHALETYAEKHEIRIPYLLAGVYAVWLAEASDRSDAVFLMPRLNRQPEERDTLGCYTLLVPVRVRVEQGERLSALCKKVQQAARDASSHKQAGYGEILSILRGENIISDVLSAYVFNFYRFALQTEIECQLDISVAGAMKNHLTWTVFRNSTGLDFRLDLRDGIYDEEKGRFFLDAVRKMLEHLEEDPVIGDLEAVGEAEREKLGAVRGKTTELDHTATIPSMFAEVVRRCSGEPALYAGRERYTFGQLDEITDRIAGALVQRGVVPGDRVAFMLSRDIRLIPAMLGILKAGAVFIPVDPAYPKDRVDYILEDSDAAFLISSADVPEAAGHSFLEICELMTEEEVCFIPPVILQEQPAYMIYTSGTTGRPKGVILSHRGIVNIVHPDNNPFNRDIVKNCKGITAIGSICFDISLFEIFVPLLNGLFIEFGNEKSMIDAGELARHILAHGADILHCTPSRIVSYLGNASFREALQSVQAVLSAGEVLPESLVRELKTEYGIRIYNGYGPTETTIGATITEAGDDETIGGPIANMGLLLLNKNKKQVPYGAAGEICIYGEGVGIGYRNRPEETADRFILYQGQRVYRTGDIAHLTEDGRLIYHGRNDRQVKLRGLRIELMEIERVLGSFPGVGQVHCMIRSIEKVEHLAAFYTVEPGAQVDRKDLEAHMRGRLTAYMVPDIIKELEVMPQTPGGKTDLRALKEMPLEYQRAYRKPTTRTEKKICQAFGAVLEKEKIGLDDNFFELGGDSLGVPELILELEERLELEEEHPLEFSDIFQYPTPALLADRLGGAEAEQLYRVDHLDYRGIDAYLEDARKKSMDQAVQKKCLGNILLTGVTGYLGIHILVDLLHRPEAEVGKIYCLARGNARLTAEKRVRGSLFYYAEEDFSESYGSRWEVVEGDITNPSIVQQPLPEQIHTIIHSAANVAHFAYGDTLERVNTKGTEHLVEFALEQGAELCQISTISVGGVYPAGEPHEVLTEHKLYMGQEIHNQYIYSKYMAEYAMLRAGVDRGLSLKLMRVGNLQGRLADGEFQMNMKSNAFTRRLSGYIGIGAMPSSVYQASVNFSPVDETAHMIVSLAMLDGIHAAFHVYPPEEASFAELAESLEKIGHSIREVPDEEFELLLSRMKKTREGASAVTGLLTDIQDAGYVDHPIDQTWTCRMLEALGERWRPITRAYLERYLQALDGMDMF